MRLQSLALVALSVVVAACAPPPGVRYDAGRDVSVFESTAINIGQPIQGTTLGASRIALTASAQCAGEGCVPEDYVVALSKDGGNAAVADYDYITFETEDGTVSFGDEFDADGAAQFFSTTQGEFVRLSVPARIYASFAESPTLTIRLGASAYQIAYQRRAPLRRLLPSPTEDG